MDTEKYNAWLDSGAEVSFEEYLKGSNNTIANTSHKGIMNYAKPVDSMFLISESGNVTYMPEEIEEEMATSLIGQKVLEWIGDSEVSITIYEDEYGEGNRGDQLGNNIRIFSKNIKNVRVAAQTVIHEMTHYHYDIGGSQFAEAICFGMEKLHLTGKAKLSKTEWEYVKELAISAYPEYEWENGGYGKVREIQIVE